MSLYLNTKPIKQPQGTWDDARNIITSRIKDVIINEEGNEITASNFPENYDIVGRKALPDESIIVFLSGVSNDKIGLIKNNNYTDIISDSLLNLSKEYPVFAEYQFNAKGETIIAFTDDNNPPRILNIDTLPFNVNSDKSLVNDEDIVKLSLFPESVVPTLSNAEVIQGGAVKSGAYYVSFGYKSNDGTKTNYHGIFGPYYVTDGNTGDDYSNYDGIEAGRTTNKAIKFTLEDLDDRYDKVVMVIISKIDGVTSASIVNEFDIGGLYTVATYTGTESVEQISIDETFINRASYTKAKTITQLNDRLYLGNLESQTAIDFQYYANGIVVNYVTKKITGISTSITNSHKSNQDKTFMFGEVYALYVAFELKNGGWTRAFHIPGRNNVPFDTSSSQQATTLGLSYKKFQFEDTCDKNGQTYTPGSTSYPTGLGLSNMGYWENENEEYPDDFPELSGRKVRHHKFPSINHVKNQHYASDTKYGISNFSCLGIICNFTRSFPQDIKDKVIGYRIFYAKPTVENSTVLGTDFIHGAATRLNSPSIVWNSGGNWDINAQGSGSNPEDLIFDPKTIRCACPDLLRNKPSVSPTHFTADLLYTKTGINDYYENTGKEAGIVTRTGDGLGQVGTILMDLTSSNTSASVPNSLYRYKKVDSFEYIPQNVNNGNDWNITSNEIALMKLGGNSSLSDIITKQTYKTCTNNRSPDAAPFDNTNTYNGGLMVIHQAKVDVYNSFETQLLVSTDVNGTTDSLISPVIFGGDCFISHYSYISKAPINGDTFFTSTDKGKTGVHSIYSGLLITRNNFNLRYEDVSLVGSKYYPKTAADEFILNYPNEDLAEFIINTDLDQINYLAYNDDYSSVNDINPVFPASISDEDITNFPYRVIRSDKADKEETGSGIWRNFLQTDYYEANKNRGEIENIQHFGDVLLIHHKHGLFRTIGNEILQTGTIEVTLGSGDIFSKEPKDVVISEHGYLGCSDRFFAFICKYGYIWIDANNRGKIFLLSPTNGVKELSKDISNWLDTNITSTGGNPLIGNGISGCYDDFNTRLVFTHKGNNDFTLSYNLDEDKWVCFHDYTPSILFSTRNKMYSVIDKNIYTHNADNKAEFAGIIYPSYIQPIINNNPKQDKHIYNVSWNTEIRDKNDNLLQNITFNSIRFITSYQDTGDILLVPFSSFGINHNIRRRKSTWNFNDIKIQNQAFFKKEKIIDKYVKIRLTFNNEKTLENSQNFLYLYDISVKQNLLTS